MIDKIEKLLPVAERNIIRSHKSGGGHDPANRSGLSTRPPRLSACTLLVEPSGLG